jgi:hypothetical protein
MMESLLRDIRMAIRGLCRHPGFAVVAILTLALGIGATTTVFSVVYGVLFRPLPFPRADRLVQIVQLMEEEAGERHRVGLTPDQFLNLQEHATTLDAVGVFAHASSTLTGVPIPARLNGAAVLPELFDGLGARPLRGRTFTPEDGHAAPGSVVMLSDGRGGRISADARTSSSRASHSTSSRGVWSASCRRVSRSRRSPAIR